MSYLIVGLGNPGLEYAKTRHNAGFLMANAWVNNANGLFKEVKYGSLAEVAHSGNKVFVLKPNLYMNLSGQSVAYWMHFKAISMNRLLVLVDDLALPFGELRLKPGGSAGGHNGLKDIEACLKTNTYARLRLGIGNNFSKGQQANYVLSNFNETEQTELPAVLNQSCEIIKTWLLQVTT